MKTQTEHQANYLMRRRANAKSYLGDACVGCGVTDDLDFDHVDPSSKEIEIGQAIAKHWSWARLVKELDKCQLLCRPCHVLKSRSDGSSAGGHNKVLSPSHGTQVMYAREGCKCDVCRNWKRLYRKGLVDARGNNNHA